MHEQELRHVSDLLILIPPFVIPTWMTTLGPSNYTHRLFRTPDAP